MGRIKDIKTEPYYQIGILFPDGKSKVKKKCSLNDLFLTYFLNLDKLLDPALTAEEIYDKYQQAFKDKGIKISINYIDSWGHIWKGKVAWPRKDKFIEFLNQKVNDR